MPKTNEWTLMFYCASDNALAPEIVSQLKSIKNAGYHHEVNVIAYFDPQPAGTPAHIFDVNAIYKLKRPHDNDIGFASHDPFIRSLIDDRLWGAEKGRDEKTTIRKSLVDRYKEDDIIYSLPSVTNDIGSSEDGERSLRSFLNFCARAYPANHYMLFILGHGLVVGDDIFLFDEHSAQRSVTLRELGNALTDFKTMIGEAEFELVGFHSCSMSSCEVAFQLQDTANYMLASQGPAFVNSWPYRQIILRIFNDVAGINPSKNVKELLLDIFSSVYYNSADYLLAGYSFDLCLCDLKGEKIDTLTDPIKKLSEALVEGLTIPLVNYAILLAHWKSQSYFQENYTDLYDFCLCLECYCDKFIDGAKDSSYFPKIKTACQEVIKVLSEPPRSLLRGLNGERVERGVASPADSLVPSEDISNNPIVCAKFAGPDSQYSHGFSIFFPWARPMADRTIMKEYEQYNFNHTEWLKFLDAYWGPIKGKDIPTSTMRPSHKDEDDERRSRLGLPQLRENRNDMLDEDIFSLMFNAEGPLNINGTLGDPPKPNPQSSTGDSCTCGSIKNYRRDTRKRSERIISANPTFQTNFSFERRNL
jgi:hypothetical protein